MHHIVESNTGITVEVASIGQALDLMAKYRRRFPLLDWYFKPWSQPGKPLNWFELRRAAVKLEKALYS